MHEHRSDMGEEITIFVILAIVCLSPACSPICMKRCRLFSFSMVYYCQRDVCGKKEQTQLYYSLSLFLSHDLPLPPTTVFHSLFPFSPSSPPLSLLFFLIHSLSRPTSYFVPSPLSPPFSELSPLSMPISLFFV